MTRMRGQHGLIACRLNAKIGEAAALARFFAR